MLMASGIILVLLAFLIRHDQSFDLQYHLFFGKHYSSNWFGQWEPKWYGGFSVYTYPPLVHQLLALIGFVVGLDAAARILTLVAVVALMSALVNLADAFGHANGRHGASLLVLAWPAPFVFALVWGQLPAMLSTAFSVHASAQLIRYLRTGRTRDVVLWALLAGCSGGAHHQTAFVLLPLLGGVAAATAVSRTTSLYTMKRLCISGAAAGIAVLAAVGPHLWWLMTQNLPQAPIPHPTRDNFLADPFAARLLVTSVWGPVLLLLPLTLWHGARQRDLRPLTAAVLLCAVLSLGTMTPLPRMLFRSWDEWLTYERFGLWASGFTVVLAGCWIRRATFRESVILIIFGTVATIAILVSLVLPARVRRADDNSVAAMRAFLDAGDRSEWSYLTLGVGENRLSRLSWTSRGKTIDGFYFTARRDPVLRGSGIGTIDSALDSVNGRAVLDYVLSGHAQLGVRWILSMDPRADAVLSERRWMLETTLPDSTGPPLSSKRVAVRVWESPAGQVVPRWADISSKPIPAPRIFPLLWGTASLAECIAVLMVLLCITLRRWRCAVNARRPKLCTGYDGSNP